MCWASSVSHPMLGERTSQPALQASLSHGTGCLPAPQTLTRHPGVLGTSRDPLPHQHL